MVKCTIIHFSGLAKYHTCNKENNMTNFFKNILTQTRDALRAIPGAVTAIFILSVISMNLLANKSIFNLPWLASTAGIFVSWISFLCMDAVCKRFGAKTATILNTVAMIMSLLTALLYALIVSIPGIWAASFAGETPDVSAAINAGLDATFASTWYVILGSALAMFLGGVVNSVANKFVGKKFDKKDDYKGFAIRSFISTALGQFVDNFVFALFVSFIFFGWTVQQVFVCSFMMMLLELVFEVVFSPIGYRISKKWKQQNVGADYIKKYTTEA